MLAPPVYLGATEVRAMSLHELFTADGDDALLDTDNYRDSEFVWYYLLGEAWAILALAVVLAGPYWVMQRSGLTFENNTADHGAGLYLRTTDFTLTHSVFRGNVSGSTGGAMVIGGPGESYSKVQDYCPCPAVDATGAINFVAAYQNQADDGGSAVWIHSPNLTIENSILFQNGGTQAIVDLTEPPPQEPGVDRRMKSLHPPIHDLRESRHLVNRGHGDPRLGQGPRRPPGRDDLHPPPDQRSCERNQVGLVADRKKGPDGLHGVIRESGHARQG